MTIATRRCESEYENAISAETVLVGSQEIGDLVNFDSRGAFECTAWAVIFTAAMRPYSNARFATRDGAMNYMRLVASATGLRAAA